MKIVMSVLKANDFKNRHLLIQLHGQRAWPGRGTRAGTREIRGVCTSSNEE